MLGKGNYKAKDYCTNSKNRESGKRDVLYVKRIIGLMDFGDYSYTYLTLLNNLVFFTHHFWVKMMLLTPHTQNRHIS